MPSQAIEELDQDTNWLCLTIMKLRAFASTKDRYDRAVKIEDLPESPMLDKVIEIDFEFAKEDIEK